MDSSKPSECMFELTDWSMPWMYCTQLIFRKGGSFRYSQRMEDHLKTVDVNQGSSFSTTNRKNMKDFINFRCEQDEERGKREEFQFA